MILVLEPTVERPLLWRIMFCLTAIAGQRPCILSNLSSSSSPASIPKDCRYCLRPSSNMISNIRLDFPDPLTPVATISLFLGMEMSMFLRLCTRAPFIVMLFTHSPLFQYLTMQEVLSASRYQPVAYFVDSGLVR
ncbi:hypothetical protein D3C73_948500 [compost metagenome]